MSFWVDNLRSHSKSTRFPCANHVVRGLQFLQLSGSLLIVWLFFSMPSTLTGAVATALSSAFVSPTWWNMTLSTASMMEPWKQMVIHWWWMADCFVPHSWVSWDSFRWGAEYVCGPVYSWREGWHLKAGARWSSLLQGWLSHVMGVNEVPAPRSGATSVVWWPLAMPWRQRKRLP